jgi:prepilin-type N-terminal cleavage/methylation domain-containing protein
MKTTSQRKNRGFTLIELLVVIAIIAILAALILPALARAKQKGYQIKCVANMKQVDLAYLLWINDHEAKFLPFRTLMQDGGNQDFPNGGGLNTGSAIRGEVWFQYSWISNELAAPMVLSDPGDHNGRPTPIQLATSWEVNPYGGLSHPNYRNNACSYGLGMDCGAVAGGALLPWDAAQNHMLLMDRNVTNDGKAGSCSSTIPNITVMHRITGDVFMNSWTNAVHGANSGNVALLDGSVHNVTSVGLRQLLALGDDGGDTHWLFPF